MKGLEDRMGSISSHVSQGEEISLYDGFPAPKGMVDIYVQDGEGDYYHVHHDPNLIVDLARTVIVDHLDPAIDNDGGVIDTFKIGTGGHESGDILTPVAPTVDDTSLEDGSPFSKAPSSIDQIDNTDGLGVSLRFTIPLEKSEANGGGDVAYTEAGLFCNDGTMFARETFPAIVKNDNRRVVFEWTLRF